MFDEIIIKAVGDAMSPLEQRVRELELLIHAISIDKSTDAQLSQTAPLLSRKKLAHEMGCSERYLQDNIEFKSIEHRLGGRIFYDREEIRIILNSKKRVKNHV